MTSAEPPGDRLDLLAGLAPFAGLDLSTLSELAALACEIEVVPGRRLAGRGQIGPEVLIVLEGTAVRIGNNGERTELGNGEVIGAEAMQATGSSGDVEAVSEMRLLAIPADRLRERR